MKLQPSSSRKGQSQQEVNVDLNAGHGPSRQKKNTVNEASAPQASNLATLPPVPASNGLNASSSTASASTSTSTSTRARSTPPAFVAEKEHELKHRERRKSLLRSPSKTSLKRAANWSSSAASKDAPAESSRNADCERPYDDTTTTTQSPQRQRRKSFKDLFIPSSSSRTGQVSPSLLPSTAGPHPPSSPTHPDSTKPRRRYSFASPSSSSSSSSAVSPTSSTSIRKSTSTSAFRQNKDHQLDSHIPPVPALPAHIPLASLSPVHSTLVKRPSSTYLTLPQTPTSTTSSAVVPQSAKSTSSSTLSSPQAIMSASQISRSSSVPTLYASAGSIASPSSSDGTIATPQTIDLRSPPSSGHGDGVQSDRVEKSKELNNKKNRQELSPLLLGPCFSDALLSSDTLHTAEILKAMHEGQDAVEDIKSEDGYGSDGDNDVMSTESDGYGAASNISHGVAALEIAPSPMAEYSDDTLQTAREGAGMEVKPTQASTTRRLSNASSRLRVDTSLASASSLNTAKRSSAYYTSHTSSASLSPLSHSFPASPTYNTNAHTLSSTSSPSSRINAYTRTPTPTLTAVPSPSPRLLSQGAKICLDYTMLRLKKDGNSSPSTQPEKVNILQWGGRRYPSSTRRLSLSPLNVTSANVNDVGQAQTRQSHYQEQVQQQQHQAHQQRREPRSVNLYRELAWIGIIRKLQSRRRLTLMEEVELDGFKKLQSQWTPCSSPLAFEFSSSAVSSTTPRHVENNVMNSITKTCSAPPSSTSKSIALHNGIPQNHRIPSPRNAHSPTQPALAEQASQQQRMIPVPPPTTSALVSGAFLRAQQVTWKTWISRLSFDQRMVIILPQGECVKIVPQLKGQLIISERIYAWASATLEDVNIPSQSHDIQRNSSSATISMSTPTSNKSAVASPSTVAVGGHTADDTQTPSIDHIREEPPFTRNRISTYTHRTPSSEDPISTHIHVHFKESSTSSETAANLNVKNGKNTFGQTLAARLGFRSGKNKVSLPNPPANTDSRESSPATTDTTQESSSASSVVNTITPKSTPATSASSACSDQMDIDIALTAKAITKPVRPQKSSLRPTREQRPLSIVKSESPNSHLSHPGRPNLPPNNNSPHAIPNDSVSPGNTSGLPAPTRPFSMMPKSHSDQRLSTYSERAMSQDQDGRTLKVEPGNDRIHLQRRVRVLSQPEGVMTPRPHSMFTKTTEHSRRESAAHMTQARPISHFQTHSRPKSLVVPGPKPGQNSGNWHSDPHIRTATGSQDLRHMSPLGPMDDDETPLAVLRRNSGTPPALRSSSLLEDTSGLPEPRPRLRSAMRSSSQPRPVSMLSASNRNSMIVTQQEIGHVSRSSSPASNRLSVHDANPRNGRESWHKGEETLKSLIREEQLKQEREAEEIKRRREQRKIWEEHRRRSVYLDEQAAAAEKAANEANRRQSQLYMSMALAQPQSQPYIQPMMWTNGIHSPAYGMQQPQYPFPQQPLYNARPPIMHSRPTSYHQDQNINGQPSISYGQYMGTSYQNHMR